MFEPDRTVSLRFRIEELAREKRAAVPRRDWITARIKASERVTLQKLRHHQAFRRRP